MEQTAHLQTALLHRFLVRTQIRTAQRGSIRCPWSPRVGCHIGLVELDHCRSDLSTASSNIHVWQEKTNKRQKDKQTSLQIFHLAVYAAAGAAPGAPGLTLTWRASKGFPWVITAHRMRACLLASATAAFCQPAFSRSLHAH